MADLNVSATTALGAKVGTAILPGVGTAIGAIIGLAGSTINNAASKPDYAMNQAYIDFAETGGVGDNLKDLVRAKSEFDRRMKLVKAGELTEVNRFLNSSLFNYLPVASKMQIVEKLNSQQIEVSVSDNGVTANVISDNELNNDSILSLFVKYWWLLLLLLFVIIFKRR